MKYTREAPRRASGLTRLSQTTPGLARAIAHLWAMARPSLYDRAVKRAPRSAWLLVCALAPSACGVEFLPSQADEAVANTCETDADCGSGATCNASACFAKSGVIDEVLLEVIPDSNSSSGGLSFLSMQTGIHGGLRQRNVPLPARSPFIAQVLVNGSDFKDNTMCEYRGTGKKSIQARIEFLRTGAVGGVPILGLTNLPVTVDTVSSAVGWNAPASLLPGTYDVYIQPASSAACPIAPRIFRGITVGDPIVPSAPPATFDLPTPSWLSGMVQRSDGATLVGWQVDIIEPQEGRTISPLGALGTTAGQTFTNFKVNYQPVAAPSGPPNPNGASNGGPLIRIAPPKSMADSAPTVYWDLAAADLHGDGTCNLDMTGVPKPEQLVKVIGQVNDPGIAASVQFYGQKLDGAPGLTASFNQTVMTDDAGHYEIQLFPGQYRVVVIPAVSAPDATLIPPNTGGGSPIPTGAATRPWSLVEQQWTISKDAIQAHNLVLPAKRVVEGTAYAGSNTEQGAPGATLEAVATISPAQIGALRGVLAQTPVLPQNASVHVDDQGRFSLPLDPGDFDLSLRAPESSTFAWWVWPDAHVAPPDPGGHTIPIRVARLPFPVPLEGIMTVPDEMGVTTPLRGAAVRAYAKNPSGTGVTKVGDARTDDMGSYHLRLPPSFFGAP